MGKDEESEEMVFNILEVSSGEVDLDALELVIEEVVLNSCGRLNEESLSWCSGAGVKER